MKHTIRPIPRIMSIALYFRLKSTCLIAIELVLTLVAFEIRKAGF
jgi:hypothetical protein